MSTKEFTLQQLLDWCKKKTEAGHELTIKWDGGKKSQGI